MLRVLPFLLLILAACQRPAPQGDAEALALIDRARTHHGSALLDRAEMRFSFRGTPYTIRRDDGRFRYSRTTTDSLGRTVEEVVDNDGTHRFVDGVEVPLDAAEAGTVGESINSVVYFATLPRALADAAVRARLLTPDRVAGEDYDRVEVTFAEEGGGADAQDRYVYWLRDNGEIGYYAYSYVETPGDTARAATGTRFRVPLQTRRVGGVLVQDWRNLSADSLIQIERFGDVYDARQTFEVSQVILDDVVVEVM